MKHAFWITLLYFVTQIAYAFDSSPSVFYPLPTESQGRVFTAQQLFLASSGGLWIHDVRGKVLFFDGQSVAPKWGSALPYSTEKLVVQNDSFWTFDSNLVYRSSSNHQREVVFELSPGSEITKMGSVKNYIWVADEANFYTYRISDGDFETYSLMELYRYNQSVGFAPNDALRLKERWVLATNGGVFVSEGQGFRHVSRSKGNAIEQLYFSESRRELILGSRKGAVVYDINNTGKPKFIIPSPNVTSISETTQAYWIGTENGLYVYSFITGKIRKYSGEKDAGFALEGRRIHSIINDNSGGMWVATNKGIYFFSLFGDIFERFPTQNVGSNSYHPKINNLVAMDSKLGYWALKDTGLYHLPKGQEKNKQLVYSANVHNIVEHAGIVWLATNAGLIALDANTGERRVDIILPEVLNSSVVTHLAVDSKGNIWVVNDKNIWCYNPEKGELKTVANQWMLPAHGTSKLKVMTLTSLDELLLGTEHGVYLLKNKQLKFMTQSSKYGSVHSMEEGSSHQIWIASSYGVNIFDTNTGSLLPLSLVDEHVGPKCLVNNNTGTWLTSSAGLSHYSANGQLLGHYGAPFGVINNEFLSNFCLLDAYDQDSLLLGSWHSLIRVNSRDLIVSPLPDATVLFSQVRINQNLVAFGSTPQSKIIAPYGESISVQMGILPHISGSSLEYRLNNENTWTQLDGYQIAMEGLAPGQYKLYVRPVVNGIEKGGERSITFLVTEPWFLSSLAFIAYVATGLTILFGSVYWRSRMMTNANRRLKAQVALKTNQLRHQSRILLSNNHQLRKQLQVRRLIFSQAIQSFRERLRTPNQVDENVNHSIKRQMVEQISSELELLLNVRESQGQESPAYNLSMIFASTLNGWCEELSKSGVSVEMDSSGECDAYVLLKYFNLDILLNLLFDGLVKRCFRHQVVHVEITCTKNEVLLQITDYGIPIDLEVEGYWGEITKLVDISGGSLSIDERDGQNVVYLSWPRSKAFDENSVVGLDNFNLKGVDETTSDPFIERLEELVLKHYTEPEFSTSTAAKMLFVSERSLQRRFKGATQRTFSDYLSEVRLDNACRHLLAGIKVADVAYDCGFNDPSYFSQRFKHRFGVSPTQFVEQSYNREESF
ncbi:helix-turn-helix domain-containing protein [Vibrio kasasachensis]|uniref:helix-turn-helix domain-containing protein n=1 Tax=Vibrio kasasachensis TaxID=2910248 RepID=UPI003D0D0A60